MITMAVPDLIPIKYEPEYRTNTIGRYADGQFFGCVTAGFGENVAIDDKWAANKRWYAVLHRFDHDGHHLGSDISFAGTTADGERMVVDKADEMLREWLARLASPAYGDIAVRLFRLEVDGITFGLVHEVDDQHGDWVELYPNDLGFTEPWDGEYDT